MEHTNSHYRSFYTPFNLKLNGCQLIHLNLHAMDMERAGVEISKLFLKLAESSQHTIDNLKDLLTVASVENSLVSKKIEYLRNNTLKKSKYTKEQHKLAIRHSNRRK